MLPSWNQLFYAVSALSKAAGLHQRISISIRTYARVTWDQALFWFRFLINIPAGMAKRKEILAVAVRENVWEPLKLGLINARAEWHIWLNSPFPSRLRVVPHISSRILERVKRERAWKSPHARNGDTRRGERIVIMSSVDSGWRVFDRCWQISMEEPIRVWRCESNALVQKLGLCL